MSGTVSPQEIMQIRKQNLLTVAEVLRDYGVTCWLQGKTLRGVFRDSQLETDDHDDDLGIWRRDRECVFSLVIPQLQQLGFEVLREGPEMLSVQRNGRYLDLCLFSVRGQKAGYQKKWFPVHHFLKLDLLTWESTTFDVPSDTDRLLSTMYPVVSHCLPSRAFRFSKRVGNRVIHEVRKRLPRPTLSQTQFLNCGIESVESINWILRGSHLNLVTDDAEVLRVGEIIDWLRREGLETLIRDRVQETDLTREYEEPINVNWDFWGGGGNNFFIYRVLAGFRRGVLSYQSANEYIKSGQSPMLFSREYFESLPEMSEAETATLLRDHPIAIRGEAIVHGKHRAFAMIGRLLRGQTYIPFVYERLP